MAFTLTHKRNFSILTPSKRDFLSIIQDEGAGSTKGRDKDSKDDEGGQEDEESGKEVNSYFPGLTPLLSE